MIYGLGLMKGRSLPCQDFPAFLEGGWWQRGKHILSDSLLNLPCLCRAIKWSGALISYLQARRRWERLERNVRSGHRIPRGTESTLVRAEGGGEPLCTSLLMIFFPPHQKRGGWCLCKELKTIQKRLVWTESLSNFFLSSSCGSFCSVAWAAARGQCASFW